MVELARSSQQLSRHFRNHFNFVHLGMEPIGLMNLLIYCGASPSSEACPWGWGKTININLITSLFFFLEPTESGESERSCTRKPALSFCKCSEQCGVVWAQMGHREEDPMGTQCPLHPISSLSHGGISPGRERRHREKKGQDLCFLVQKSGHMCIECHYFFYK